MDSNDRLGDEDINSSQEVIDPTPENGGEDENTPLLQSNTQENTLEKEKSLIRQTSRRDQEDATPRSEYSTEAKALTFADSNGSQLVEKTHFSDQLYYSPANEDYATPISKCCIIQ